MDPLEREIANIAYQLAELRNKSELLDERLKTLQTEHHRETLDNFQWIRSTVREKIIWLPAFVGALLAGIALRYLLPFLP